MLSKQIESALNEQIKKEAFAANAYLAMGSWCDVHSLKGAQAFYYEQSAEEREHMMKIINYVNEQGGQAMVSEIKAPQKDFESIEEIVNKSLQQEQDVTKSIYHIVDLCLAEKDHGTFNFLQWFVAEQQEEEALFRALQEKIRMVNNEGGQLLILDNEFSKLKLKLS